MSRWRQFWHEVAGYPAGASEYDIIRARLARADSRLRALEWEMQEHDSRLRAVEGESVQHD